MTRKIASSPQSALSSWINSVLPRIRSISPDLALLYDESRNLHHYRELANLFERRFADIILARAAFLHGIPLSRLPEIGSEHLDEEVLDILKEREKLRALNVADLNVKEQLLADVLPSLKLARTIILFILEQLHHLDSEEKIARWSIQFHRSPSPLPPDLSSTPLYKYGSDLENLGNFSRNVVAPTAKFFGLWHERNVIEDASLLYYERERFNALLSFAEQETSEAGECPRLTKAIKDLLADLVNAGKVTEVIWEWRHIGSLARHLPKNLTDSRRMLHRAGFVTVICDSQETCYLGLHRLHANQHHRLTELKDFLGQPTLSGYKALHTVLTPQNSTVDAIAVRLVVLDSSENRWRPADPDRLELIAARFQSQGLGLRAFTPDGRSVQLPVGATVLDFAYALNNRWVAFLSGATVNRQPVEVLHRLSPDDIVWLEISGEPQLLPADWQSRLPEESARNVNRQLRKYYRPLILAEARRWLREQLQSREIRTIPEDDDQLDAFVEEAGDRLAKTLGITSDKRGWLLLQMGLHAVSSAGKSLPFSSRLSLQVLEDTVVEEVGQLIKTAKFITLQELDIPDDLKYRLKHVVFCKDCSPSLREEWAATESRDGLLVLHRVDAKCCSDGIQVSRLRPTVKPQYVLIETTNRVGVGADILSVFQRHKINLVELAGRQIGPAWGAIRVQFGYVSTRKFEALLERLRQVWGVKTISYPEDEIPAVERYLPPRSLTSHLILPAPYICGNPITDDAFFYGMQQEQVTLQQLFVASNTSLEGGKSAFVHGPKRIGKTSLVKWFLRTLDTTSYHCLTVHYEALKDLPWSKAEPAISTRLIQRAELLAKRRGLELPNLEGMPLADTIEAIKARLDCAVVIAIDEATGLFESTGQARESELIHNFRTRVEHISRLLTVWVGPEAPVRHLPSDLQHVLQRSELIRVGSLTVNEVWALLRAEKLAPKYDISVDRSLARAAHALTAGNPFWTSLLGKSLYDLAHSEVGSIAYNHDLLQKAKQRIVEVAIPFVDRFSEGPQSIIMLLLAQHHSTTGKGMRRRVVQDALSRKGLEVSSQELEHLLDELKARGSLITETRHSQILWKISAPILAEFVIQQNRQR